MTRKIIENDIGKLVSGINKAADIICPTLGPSGRNVAISRPYQTPIIVNDGGTISEHIFLEDETEQLAVDIIKEATRTADRVSADGRTTTVCILRELVNTLYEKTKGLSKNSPAELKRIVGEEITHALSILNNDKKTVKTLAELKKIALTSSGDRGIADIIAETYWGIGEDGVITIEDGFGEGIEVVRKDGMEIPYKVEPESLRKKLDKTHILITNEKIESVSQIMSLYDKMKVSGLYKLAIIAPDFSDSIISEFKQLIGAFDFLPIKIPKSDIEVYEDVASITGAKVLERTAESNIEDLGMIDNLEPRDGGTLILGVIKPVEHIKSLKNKEITSEFDKDKNEKRIARLNNGIVIMRIGSVTEQERDYIKLKTADAIKSTQNALRGGYVSGGGQALLNVAEQMKDSLIYKAITSPYNTIQKNHGAPLEISKDVIDPFITVEQELKTAGSLASMFITTHASIADKIEEEDML